MKTLHPVQEKLLELLKKNSDDPLTVRELQSRLDISSPSVVQHHITQLIKRGRLRRDPGNPQDYQVIDGEPEKQIVYLPLYGLAQCGPAGTILSADPTDRIPLSSRLLSISSADAFLVKARGDSMEPRIHQGDLVIAKKSSAAAEGDLVVCVHKEEALIKKIHKEGKNVILQSLNAKYSPMIAERGNFKIEGIVKGVISLGM